jgi:preprotein translocase subunit SecE
MASKKKTKAGAGAEQDNPEVSGWAIFRPSVIHNFISEVKAEFKKIVWPDKKVTLGLTGLVSVFVLFMALYLGSVDLILGKLVSSILR